MKDKFKSIGAGSLVILLYFITMLYPTLPFKLLNVDFTSMPTFLKVTYAISLDIVLLFLIYLVFKKDLIKDFKDFKKNNLNYFKKYLKIWLYGLIAMYFCNLIMTIINNGNLPGNEEGVRNLLTQMPFYMFISAVVLGPTIEELIFRKGIRKILFFNDKLFIIFAGLIFGSLHVVGNINSWIDLLYIIPYSSLGVAFAYMYVKSKNIFVPIMFHTIHNGLLVSLQILLSLFV